MRDIKVDKASLIDKITENLAAHQSEYEAAVVIFRERAIAAMEQQLASAKRGDKVILHVSLPVPEEHTSDYEQALAMLDWELEDTVELDEHSFATLVRNEWGWARSFAANTSLYTSGSN